MIHNLFSSLETYSRWSAAFSTISLQLVTRHACIVTETPVKLRPQQGSLYHLSPLPRILPSASFPSCPNMEALAAISLAGNILQFLNFTGDAITKSRQIHASISGTLKEHDHQEGLTTDLKNLSVRLQASAGPAVPVLKQLCSSYNEVTDELLKALGVFWCQREIHTVSEPQKGIGRVKG